MWGIREQIREGPEMAWDPRKGLQGKTTLQLGTGGKQPPGPGDRWAKSVQSQWNSPSEGLGQREGAGHPHGRWRPREGGSEKRRERT